MSEALALVTRNEPRRSPPFTCPVCNAYKKRVTEKPDGFHGYTYDPRIYTFDTCSPECARVAYQANAAEAQQRITTLEGELAEAWTKRTAAVDALDDISRRYEAVFVTELDKRKALEADNERLRGVAGAWRAVYHATLKGHWQPEPECVRCNATAARIEAEVEAAQALTEQQ